METTWPLPLSVLPSTPDDPYARLVAERKECRDCGDLLVNPRRVLGGKFDSDRIGPFSNWQGNRRAELMVVAQDFASVDKFIEVEGWPGIGIETNKALVKLVRAAGIEIRLPERGVPDDRLFFTNAVLCLKPERHDDPVPTECVRRCARRFLKQTIEHVRPRAIAAIGGDALDAILWAYGERRRQSLTRLIERGQAYDLPCGPKVFPLFHTGPRAAGRRSPARQEQDWTRLGEWLRTGDPSLLGAPKLIGR